MATKINATNVISENVAFTAINTTAQALAFGTKDEKTAVVLKNQDSASVTVTFEKGDGYAATTDLSVTVPSESTCFICLDSARFKNLSGDNKGKIRLKASKASVITAAVIELP